MKGKKAGCRIFPHQQKELLNDFLLLLANKGYLCKKPEKIIPVIENIESIIQMDKKRLSQNFDGHAFENNSPLNECFVGRSFDYLKSLNNISEEVLQTYASQFQNRLSAVQNKKKPSLASGKEKSEYVFVQLYPNDEAAQQLEKTYQAVEYVYNLFFDLVTESYNEQKNTGCVNTWLRHYAMSPELTRLKKKETWLNTVDSTALQNALKDVDKVWGRYYTYRKVQNTKPKEKRKTIEIPLKNFEKFFCITSRHVSFNEKEHTLKLPKINEPIKIKIVSDKRMRDSKPSSVIVTRNDTSWLAKIYFNSAPDKKTKDNLDQSNVATDVDQ